MEVIVGLREELEGRSSGRHGSGVELAAGNLGDPPKKCILTGPIFLYIYIQHGPSIIFQMQLHSIFQREETDL